MKRFESHFVAIIVVTDSAKNDQIVLQFQVKL